MGMQRCPFSCEPLSYGLFLSLLIKDNLVSWQLNFLTGENREREIVDQNCEGMQIETLDALLSLAKQCVSSVPDERPTMHRVVQMLESDVITPCPSDFYDSE
jgi:hypothetical protein